MKIWFWVYFSFVLLIILYWLKRLATKKKLGSTTSGCLGFVSLYFFIFHGLAKIGIKESLQATDISIICITFSLSIIFIISFLFHIDTGDNKKKEESSEVSIPITFTIKPVEDKDKDNEEQSKVGSISPSSPRLSDKQFEEISSCLYDIKNLIKTVCAKKSVFDAVNENSKEIGGDEMPNRTYFKKVLESIFMKDLKRCYQEMGHTFQFNSQTEEGQALILVTSILSGKDATLNDYDTFCSEVCTVRESWYSSLKKTFKELLNNEVDFSVEGSDEFGFSALLQTCGGDPEDLEKYRILLYRLVSLIAKLDGKVTEEEKSWLERMLVISELRQEGADRDYVSEKPEEELERLIGLGNVKEEVKALSNFISVQQKRKEMGLPVTEISCHCVFTGKPGTGKTTVARILAGIYRDKGILKKGHLIETDRSGLVAEYVGQTAIKTNRIIDKALDGVLFIDEAYSLIAKGEDFGQEAISTLLKRMEDDRDRLIVILAGYTNEMEEFIKSNPGLRSRFNRYIFFPDYSVDELTQIFQLYASKNKYNLSADVIQAVRNKIQEVVLNKPQDFGNARFVRNLFEKVVQSQANRLASDPNVTREKLTEILAVDIG